MLNRRMFTGCALCAALGLAADDASAQTSTGLKRTITSRADGPAQGYETLQVLVELEPNYTLEWHIHPGTEAGYAVEGTGELFTKNQEAQTIRPGSSWMVAPEVPHSFKNGPQQAKLFVTFTVQKGKPLSTAVSAPT